MNELHFIKVYRDLQAEIDDSFKLIALLERNRNYYINQLKQLEPHELSASTISGMPGAHKSPLTVDHALDHIQDVSNQIEYEQHRLWALCDYQDSVEHRAKGIDDIYHRVAFMKLIERKPIDVIARETNYSKGYIWNISQRIGK